jgi:outer membrane protein
MKKFLTLAVVALMAVSASAQKGSMYIGTSGISAWSSDEEGYLNGSNMLTGFSYSKSGDIKTTSFGLAPEFGYFITDNVAIGGSLGYTYSKVDIEDSDAVSAFGIAPYVRYFLIQSGNFGLYLQGGGQYSFVDDGSDDNTNYFNIGVLPGISYKFSDKFSATASFGWLGYENTKKGDAKLDEFGLQLDGSSLKFGLYYNF